MGGGSTKKCDHECDWAFKKSTYVSELMLWLHWGKFVNVKWVNLPSLAALEVAKYMRTVK